MSVWNLLSGLVAPVTNLIDELHTSDEERLAIKAKMFEMQMTLATQVMDYEARLMEAKTQVITAEAQGESWLQRSWRPITMLSFLGLVIADSFGVLAFRLAPQAWTLLQIGLGGYVVGRSVEKVMPSVKNLLPGERA
ncbi:holin family protein [Grimontia kaedaensis]|uniref:Holin family protein n=1 Tax=Grimontia kaedaensis TaxID=2872157 RepID=A0ABY4WNK0_9GAMM|nr:3TM-type holin [Grimontia kaedaensis]USH01098.1 holin family protein [Grimontia kaedaensis]